MPFTPPVTRKVVLHPAAEREALTSWLDYHRTTLVHKLDGLDDEPLRRPMVPTGTSLLGLVKHLTEVEHNWFVNQVAGAGPVRALSPRRRSMPFTPPITRERTRWNLSEREALENWLDYHRATIVHKLDGLDDEQARRPMVPSGVSLLGLVKHMTEVEHGWFVIRIGQADEPYLYATDDDPDADFRIEEGETADSVVAEYLRMCDRSREVMAGVASLDQTVPHPHRGQLDVRWIVLHMIEETARHNGHADIIREQIDGATEHLNP